MRKEIIILAFVVLIGAGVFYYFLNAKEATEDKANQVANVELKKRGVELFYYNSQKDRDENGNVLCSRQGLVPIYREIPDSGHFIEDVLRLLVLGELTPEERNSGLSTEYPLPGLEVVSATLSPQGDLEVLLVDPESKTSGGACRSNVLKEQLVVTAEQFSEVKSVKLIPESLFQP